MHKVHTPVTVADLQVGDEFATAEGGAVLRVDRVAHTAKGQRYFALTWVGEGPFRRLQAFRTAATVYRVAYAAEGAR